MYSKCGNSTDVSIVSMISYSRIQSPAGSKQKDARLCGFRWSLPLSIDYVWNASIDRVISTPSCSYCIWNRYRQHHRSNLSNSYCLHNLIRLNSIAWRVQTTRCSMMRFSLIPLTIDYVWNSSIDRAITTPSRSYCIWNRIIQIHRSILPKFLLFAWFDTLEFNRLVFDDPFR